MSEFEYEELNDKRRTKSLISCMEGYQQEQQATRIWSLVKRELAVLARQRKQSHSAMDLYMITRIKSVLHKPLESETAI